MRLTGERENENENCTKTTKATTETNRGVCVMK